jgi:uncharacterized protein (DUF4415 family)
MKAKYDFSKAKRGAVLPQSGNKVRITIRLDRDIVDWFRKQVEKQGGGNYQTMLNDALRDHMLKREQPIEEVEEVLRRVIREELHIS